MTKQEICIAVTRLARDANVDLEHRIDALHDIKDTIQDFIAELESDDSSDMGDTDERFVP